MELLGVVMKWKFMDLPKDYELHVHFYGKAKP